MIILVTRTMDEVVGRGRGSDSAMNVRLIMIRLRLIDVERDVKMISDNELQMSK
jgi:hypothetical protein